MNRIIEEYEKIAKRLSQIEKFIVIRKKIMGENGGSEFDEENMKWNYDLINERLKKVSSLLVDEGCDLSQVVKEFNQREGRDSRLFLEGGVIRNDGRQCPTCSCADGLLRFLCNQDCG